MVQWYSAIKMNNNKNDQTALLAGCKGVFSGTSYITIGNAEKPEMYAPKAPTRTNFAGKQFLAAPLKEGRTIDVYFEKKHPWISDTDTYKDRLKYSELQGTDSKKKGFLTSDFSKRDEFSNTIRTEQWREQLKSEGVFAKKSLEMHGNSTTEHFVETTARPSENKPFLYDLVFEKDDPEFNGAGKTHRHTNNKTFHTKDRNLGNMTTTAALAYNAPEEHVKPEYARKPLIRDTFYRQTNVFFPANCCASAGNE